MRQTKETSASFEPKRRTTRALRPWVRITLRRALQKEGAGRESRLARDRADRRLRRRTAVGGGAGIRIPSLPRRAASSAGTSETGASHGGGVSNGGVERSSIAPTASTSPAPTAQGSISLSPTSTALSRSAALISAGVGRRVRTQHQGRHRGGVGSGGGGAAEAPTLPRFEARRRTSSGRSRWRPRRAWRETVRVSSGAAALPASTGPKSCAHGPARRIPLDRAVRRRTARRRPRSPPPRRCGRRSSGRPTSSPLDCGYSVPVTPQPFSIKPNLSRGLAAREAVDRRAARSAVTRFRSVHSSTSSGFWV